MFEFTLSDPLLSLKYSCEVHCVAGCCGLSAFDVSSGHVEPWVSDNGVPRTIEALTQLEELSGTVQKQLGQIRSGADDFGDGWDDSLGCVEYLELWQRETVRALLAVAGGALFQSWWMEANGGAARSIVRAIDATRDFARLPILGDALEEAGCTAEALLAHCRRGGSHARRCWLVDLLLAGDTAGPLPPRATLPRRNRVTPYGNLIAVSARGTLMGNRGRLHDDQGRIRREFAGNRWLLCRLSFRGRRRAVMMPGHYTELFFLDEATGLAAGHRPCAECQRERFTAFRDAFSRGNRNVSGSTLSADDVDLLLNRERHPPGRMRALWEASLDELPAGTMVLLQDDDCPHLVQPGRLLPWRAEGYGPGIGRASGVRVRVLTPPATVNAIRAGYAVGVHPTATA